MILRWFEDHYYKLSFWPRHLMGITVIVLLLASVGCACYGCYYGLRAGWHLAQNLYEQGWGYFSSDEEEEYSKKGWSHFDFPIPEDKKHPKRVPNYGVDFNVINEVQLAAAKKLGITPQKDRASLEKMKGKLVKLRDTRYYAIKPLTSSSPYLVPRAADFLTALGKLMQEYNGTESRFYVSSVLRTQADVKNLRSKNGNATENSTHCYGTTIDITYSQFDVKGKTNDGKVKEDLARALYDMQSMGYCYVIYERRQPCFHITVRP